MEWLDNYSWDPTLLCDKRKATQDSEPVEPNVVEHEPGTIAWLYSDYGGEG